MDSVTNGALTSTLFTPFNSTSKNPSLPSSHLILSPNSQFKARVRVSGSFIPDLEKNRVVEKIQSSCKALVFTVAAALMIGRFSQFTARAETPVAVVEEKEKSSFTKLAEFAQSHSEAIDALARKPGVGEDEKVFEMLKLLISSQPLDLEWKFFLAGLYNETGDKGEARRVYQEILDKDPLCFDALFLNALLMDQSGEGQAAIKMLEERLNLAQGDQKDMQARNVRLILAQIQYLQRNVDEALKSFEELEEEDPADYRPCFYQHVIYNLLDRYDEAKAQLAKLHELYPKDLKCWMIQ